MVDHRPGIAICARRRHVLITDPGIERATSPFDSRIFHFHTPLSDRAYFTTFDLGYLDRENERLRPHLRQLCIYSRRIRGS
jgi:hypothetical protein